MTGRKERKHHANLSDILPTAYLHIVLNITVLLPERLPDSRSLAPPRNASQRLCVGTISC